MKSFYITVIVAIFGIVGVFGLGGSSVMADVRSKVVETVMGKVEITRQDNVLVAEFSGVDKNGMGLIGVSAMVGQGAPDDRMVDEFADQIKKETRVFYESATTGNIYTGEISTGEVTGMVTVSIP